MVCMTIWIALFEYSDISCFIFFNELARYGISMMDGFGYESWEPGIIDFIIHVMYQSV